MTLERSRVFVMLSAALSLNSLSIAQKRPAPIDLGTLGGTFSLANGVNGSSAVVVGSSSLAGDTVTHAFKTTKLVEHDLGSLVGSTGNSSAVALTPAGTVAGTSDANDPVLGTVSHAFYWAKGVMSDLGTLGGSSSSGNGVASGVAVGSAVVVGSSLITGDAAAHAFLWNGKMIDLGTLGGTNSNALGVNEIANASGSETVEVVGSADAADGTTHAALWVSGSSSTVDLGTLGGSFAQANAISKSGTVVGWSTLAGDMQTDAFVGSPGTPLVDIGTLGGSYAQANAINSAGTVVGFSNTTGDADVHAFKWTQSAGLVDLNSLLQAGSPWNLQSANGIGPDGSIVGVGIINGQAHGFVW